MRTSVAVLAVVVLTGCVTVSKVQTGDRVVGDRLMLSLTGAWNRVNADGTGPTETWTMEGLPVDQLLVYAGLKTGEPIHDTAVGETGKRTFSFRASMQPDEIAALFEGALTRDGSRYQLMKIEPSRFGGRKGFRFEYTLTRRLDNVQLSGVGYGAVSNGELFALVYMAPRLTFFDRHAPAVERIAQSARVMD